MNILSLMTPNPIAEKKLTDFGQKCNDAFSKSFRFQNLESLFLHQFFRCARHVRAPKNLRADQV